MSARNPKAMSAELASSTRVLLASAFLLSVLGLFQVFSTTLPRTVLGARDVDGMGPRQAAFLVVSAGLCWAFSRFDHRRLVALAPRALPLLWLVLAVVLVLPPVNGARRWLQIGPFGLQASEVAKPLVVLLAAWYGVWRDAEITSFRRGFLPAALGLAVTVVLVAAEPDFGTSVFLIVVGGLVLFLAGMRLRHMLGSALAVVPFFLAVMIGHFDHVMSRLQTFRDGPHEQVRRALEVMASGGLVGRGPGSGQAPLWFVPYVETDFIFASIGEQFGLAGELAVLGLFLLFLVQGFRIALSARRKDSFLLAFGLTFMVGFQALLNMSVVTGLVPPKGIGLPFVSYGGSSLLMLGCTVGILLNIARTTSAERGPAYVDPSNRKSKASSKTSRRK